MPRPRSTQAPDGTTGSATATALVVSALLAAHLAYYIVIVQFGLLRHYAELGFGLDDLRAPLGALTICGIAFALVTGAALDRRRPGPARIFALIGGGAAGIAGLGRTAFRVVEIRDITIVLGLLGAVLGAQIVLLFGAFHTRIPGPRRGLYAGLVAGATYLAANLIAGYGGSPRQIGTIAAIMLGGAVLTTMVSWPLLRRATIYDVCKTHFSTRATVWAIMPLALLVAVDSFTFFPVGQGVVIAHPIFAKPADWLQNGAMHAVFAGIFGVLYSRVGFRRIVTISAVAMAASALTLTLNETVNAAFFVRVFYSIVVGSYTVVLVAAPGQIAGIRAPRTAIAIVMSIAGFIANPAGIGVYLALGPTISVGSVWIVSAVASILVMTIAFLTEKKAAREHEPFVAVLPRERA